VRLQTKLASQELDNKVTVRINALIGQIKLKLIAMQDTFNKRDYMGAGVENMQMKTLEMDDAGSVIKVRHGGCASPNRIEKQA
jgi:hypothetical protein